MTNLRILPRRRITFRVGTNESWIDSLPFAKVDGSPLSIAGIDFAACLRLSADDRSSYALASTLLSHGGVPRAGPLVVGGPGQSVLGWSVGVEAMRRVPPGLYAFDLVGLADGDQRCVAIGTVRVVQGITRP